MGTTRRVMIKKQVARSRRGLRRALVAFMLVAAVTGVSACGGSSGSSSAPAGSKLTFADLAPFTGVDAALGPIYLASCKAATHAINAAGGVLGHQVNCKSVDTRGDPADAVPAARQLFATTSNLPLIIGVTSDEAASVVPLINANKTVVFGMTGQSEFDSVHFPYFYRLVAPDLAESYAMVAIAQKKGYKKVALAFGNDIGSQTFVAPAVSAIGKAGLQLVANETLDLHASTYRTEAFKVVSAHPEVILTEALGPTAASFLSEVKQLNGGKMIPVIGTSATVEPAWYASVKAAIGASTLAANYIADNTAVETSGSAYEPFLKAMTAVKGEIGGGNFNTYLTAPGAVHLYDGMNLAALAMTKANSTSPSTYRPFIESIGNGTPGAQVVYSFAEGVAALKAGKAIRYVGPGGPTNFDSFHDSTGIFQIDQFTPTGEVKVVGSLTPAQLRALG
jgi:ABC-type branched-subunit amino acid transport system substrate-binding protein